MKRQAQCRRQTVNCSSLQRQRHGTAPLVSIHITSDLERIADRIVCIDAGRIVFDLEKDVMTDLAGIARCRAADLERIASSGMVTDSELRYSRHGYSTDVLIPDRFAFAEMFPDIPCDRMTSFHLTLPLSRRDVMLGRYGPRRMAKVGKSKVASRSAPAKGTPRNTWLKGI